MSNCRSRGLEFDPGEEIDHEIVSTVILFPLNQEGLLSVTRESMFKKYWLTA